MASSAIKKVAKFARRATDMEDLYDCRTFVDKRNQILHHIANRTPIFALLGAHGSGKTMLVRQALREAPKDLNIVYIYYGNIDFPNLLSLITRSLKNTDEDISAQDWQHIAEHGKNILVVIDEVHDIPLATLQHLSRLLPLGVRFMLVGNKSASDKLQGDDRDVPILSEPNIMNLTPLTYHEVHVFADAALHKHLRKVAKGANYRSEITISRTGMAELSRRTMGNLRQIDSICGYLAHSSLLDKEDMISFETVQEAVDQLRIAASSTTINDPPPSPPGNEGVWNSRRRQALKKVIETLHMQKIAREIHDNEAGILGRSDSRRRRALNLLLATKREDDVRTGANTRHRA